MDQLLNGFNLDDILIYCDNCREHLRQLRIIQSAGLTVNSSKCDFATPETEYMGFTVGWRCSKATGTEGESYSKLAIGTECDCVLLLGWLLSIIDLFPIFPRFIPLF